MTKPGKPPPRQTAAADQSAACNAVNDKGTSLKSLEKVAFAIFPPPGTRHPESSSWDVQLARSEL